MSSSPIMALPQVGAEQVGYWMTFPMGTSHFMEVVNSSKPARMKGGEISASGDEAPAKVRKPYTITKQRERWTEEEHQNFLEALKLYGRAWRRIEEHIGTKTAVQIRSHAQKFFSKLEREASTGGPSAVGGSQDIEIPPPRPKRKPSHPYPRKAGGAFSSSPSFEEDGKSPPAVCSAFTPLGGPVGLSLQTAPSKNAIHTPYSTESRSLSLKTLDLQQVSHGEHKKSGSPTSLRLFGQTVIVPMADICAADTLQPNDVKDPREFGVSIVLGESESMYSPRSQVSGDVEEESGLSSPRSCMEEDGAWEKDDTIDHEVIIGMSASNESSETGTPDTGKEGQAWGKDSEACGEIEELAQTERNLNLGTLGYLEKPAESPVASMASCNSVSPRTLSPVSPNRLSNLPTDLSAITHGKYLEGQSINPPSQHAAYGGFESFAQLAGPNKGGSSFTPWHLSRAVAQQHPATCAVSAASFWRGLIPESTAQSTSNDDAGAAAAVAAATFAVASAWRALQGTVPTGIGRPNMGMVYNPVAVVAAAAKPSFVSTTQNFSLMSTHVNPKPTSEGGRQNPGQHYKCSDGSEIRDEPTVLSVTGKTVEHNSALGSSTGQCCSSPTDTGVSSYCESSSDHIEGSPARKRHRSSCKAETYAGKEGRRASSRSSNSPTGDPSVTDCERSGDMSAHLCTGSDIDGVQHGSIGCVIVKNCQASSSLNIPDSTGHSRSNAGASDRTQDENTLQIQDSRMLGENEKISIQKSTTEVSLNAKDLHELSIEGIVKNVHASDEEQQKDTSNQGGPVCQTLHDSLASGGQANDHRGLHGDDAKESKIRSSVCQHHSISTKENLSSGTLQKASESAVVGDTNLESFPSEEQDVTEGSFLDSEIVKSNSLIVASVKKGLARSEVQDGNGDALQVGGYGGCTDRNSSPMIQIGGFTVSSRYGGVGFVPYKRSFREKVTNVADDRVQHRPEECLSRESKRPCFEERSAKN